MLNGGYQRSHLGFRVHADAQPDLFGIGGDAGGDLVEDFFLYEQSRAGVAALAMVEEDAGGGAGDGFIDIGIAQDDVG